MSAPDPAGELSAGELSVEELPVEELPVEELPAEKLPAGLPAEVADWFARRTWQPAPWTLPELVAAKAGRTVSVVLPALDEEATVGHVVETVLAVGELVDEVVVLDGGSGDRTAERAAAAGARVVDRETAVPGVPVRPGKGEVLWRSLAATTGDLLVFVDADLVDVEPQLVIGLLGPLLRVPGVELVKGFYHRPLRLEAGGEPTGGGRVTELLARPVLAQLAPALAGMIQPLGGEYAGTRALLESVPFAPGYGVEIGLLLDTVRTRGLDALAQVDLGVRKHRHRTLLELGVTAAEVLRTALSRTGGPAAPVDLVQYRQDAAGRWVPVVHPVDGVDRPPMASLRAGSGASGGAGRGTIGG
jgi:glucosyl-3-phosphoglycerate synthase